MSGFFFGRRRSPGKPLQRTGALLPSGYLTHPTGQDTQRPLVDVHDGIVLPLVPIDFLPGQEMDRLLKSPSPAVRRREHNSDPETLVKTGCC